MTSKNTTQILLLYHAGNNPSAIQRALKVSRVTIYSCLHKALAMGAAAGLKDAFHRPKEPVITSASKSWVVHLACTKPKDLGYAAELWTRSALAAHVRKEARTAGHPSLARAAKSTVQKILAEHIVQPHKVKYYLERRDPEFEDKMKEVLMVYREVMLQNQAEKAPVSGTMPEVITVSIDEKPGVQAIENTAPDFAAGAGKTSSGVPRSRVQEAWNSFDLSLSGFARWPCGGTRRGAAPQS